MYVVDSVDEALKLSAADKTGARFATVDGAVVWPTGKLTLGTQVADTEGVLARKRRLNELHDDIGALTASVGAAESVVMDAEEALGAAQQDALELVAEDRRAHRRARLAARRGRTARAAAPVARRRD